MDDTLIIALTNAILVLLGVFGVWKKVWKNLNLVKEWLDVLITSITALQDGNLDQAELDKIKKEIDEAKKAGSLKALLKGK